MYATRPNGTAIPAGVRLKPARPVAQTGASAGDVSLYNAVGTINALLDLAGWFQ